MAEGNAGGRHHEQLVGDVRQRKPTGRGYIRDLLVYAVEHPRQVAHDAAHQHFLQPCGDCLK